MPTFTADEALQYDNRIMRLVPGYELLHQVCAAQLAVLLPDEANILVVGAGSGTEICLLAKLNPKWRFTAQDISADMLAIAQARFEACGISERVSLYAEDVSSLVQRKQFDVALCLLVMHFVPDNGAKSALLQAINQRLKPHGHLFFADLMQPQTLFERDAQLNVCRELGLSEIGVTRMRDNFANEFFPLDKMRMHELFEKAGYSLPRPFFKVLGFHGYVTQVQG